MIDIKKAIKIDPELAKLSDIELTEVLNSLYGSTQLFFDMWWNKSKKKSGSKKPIRLLRSGEPSGTLSLWS